MYILFAELKISDMDEWMDSSDEQSSEEEENKEEAEEKEQKKKKAKKGKSVFLAHSLKSIHNILY